MTEKLESGQFPTLNSDSYSHKVNDDVFLFLIILDTDCSGKVKETLTNNSNILQQNSEFNEKINTYTNKVVFL